MRTRKTLMIATALLATGAAYAADAEKNPLVGAWQLVSYVDTPEGGAPVETFGARPTGMFVFTADGHAAISLMRNPPKNDPAVTDPDPTSLHR